MSNGAVATADTSKRSDGRVESDLAPVATNASEAIRDRDVNRYKAQCGCRVRGSLRAEVSADEEEGEQTEGEL